MTPELQEIEVKPKQPWKPTQREINLNIAIFIFNILLTLAVIQFTGFSGKLAFVLLFIVISLTSNFLVSFFKVEPCWPKILWQPDSHLLVLHYC